MPVMHKLLVLAAPRAYLRGSLPMLIARLALNAPLRILDGGNSFGLHAVARALRRHTPAVQQHLERIRIARAFTCYQVITLLAQTPAEPPPTLCLDLLTTFYDENVSPAERRRLLRQALAHLQRLCRCAPVAVSLSAALPDQPDEWVSMLLEHAAQVWEFKHPPTSVNMRLF